MASQQAAQVLQTQQQTVQAYREKLQELLRQTPEPSTSLQKQSLHSTSFRNGMVPFRSQHSNVSIGSYMSHASQCGSPSPSENASLEPFGLGKVLLCDAESVADYLPGGKYDKNCTRRHLFDEQAQPCCIRSCNIYGNILVCRPAMVPDTEKTRRAHSKVEKFFYNLSCKYADSGMMISIAGLEKRKQQILDLLPFGGWPEYCTRTQQQAGRIKYELDTYAKWAVGAERGAIHPHLKSLQDRVDRIIWRWKQHQSRLQYWRYLLLYVYLLETFAKVYNAHAAAGDAMLYAFEAKYCYFQGSDNLWDWCREILPWHRVARRPADSDVGKASSVDLTDVLGADGPAYIGMD